MTLESMGESKPKKEGITAFLQSARSI